MLSRYISLISIIIFFLGGGPQRPDDASLEAPFLDGGGAGQPANFYGEYQGRIACQEITKDLGIPQSEECTKKKVLIFLFIDSTTGLPDQFELHGMGGLTKGKWEFQKGMPSDPNATIIELKRPQGAPFLMWEADRNVLFVLNQQRQLLKGSPDFSYTMNRIKKHISWEAWGIVSNKGMNVEDYVE